MTTNGGRPPKATRVVELAIRASVDLWHDTEHRPWATINVDGHYENWPMAGGDFRRWLRRIFYIESGETLSGQIVQDSLGVLEGKAVFDGLERPVFTRLAEHAGNIYLDLGNAEWECVEITDAGWSVVADPPVRFRHPKGMLSLPRPVCDGTISDLRRFVNLASHRDLIMLMSVLIAFVRPHGPYPVLVVHGEQGSAKSTLTRIIRQLVDPNKADLRSVPREPRDLMIAATNGWVIALDNLSHLQGWLSDALCRLSTGGGFGTRTLYENDEETLFDVQRPVILNGIEELATRGDLLERSVLLYLKPMAKDKRRSEKDFWADFESSRPAILGAVLDGVSMALRNVEQTFLEELPRMADFAVWSVAAAPALGWDGQQFLDAYTGNQSSSNELTLEASPISLPIRQLAAHGDWEGTATELLKNLNDDVDEATARSRSWPKNGRSLSNKLRATSANLRAVGIDIDFGQTSGRNSTKQITIRKLEDISDACDATDVGHGHTHEAASYIASQSDDSVADILIHSKDQWELDI